MPAREWRGPGAADERARGRGRDRVDVSVENWVQDFQQRRTFGKTNRYISPTSSAHVWVLRRTRARAVLAASVASPHLRPRDTHGRRSSSPVSCPHTRSSGLSALSTGGDRRQRAANRAANCGVPADAMAISLLIVAISNVQPPNVVVAQTTAPVLAILHLHPPMHL